MRPMHLRHRAPLTIEPASGPHEAASAPQAAHTCSRGHMLAVAWCNVARQESPSKAHDPCQPLHGRHMPWMLVHALVLASCKTTSLPLSRGETVMRGTPIGLHLPQSR